MQNKLSGARIGLLAAIFLVVGNMLGSGVFMLPASLAAVGGISVIGWIVAMLGVLALALVFAKLSNILPHGAGPYSYVRSAFGNFLGYQTNYVYILASWIANVSMISVIMGYLQNIFPILIDQTYSVIIQISIIILFTWLNIKGAKIVSILQSSALLLAIIPIISMATIGWMWFDVDTFMSGWNVSHLSPFMAVNSSLNNIMWAFIGIESACVVSAVVKRPKRNIPLATVCGVIVATLLYVSTCTVIMGIVPNAELVKSSAPFAVALSHVFGYNASILVSICAIANCLGALAGWTLVIGQMSKAAADDGLFPKIFSKTNARGIPAIGLCILAFIMILVVLVTISPTANEQFGKIITMSVLLYLIPYIYSGFAVIILGRQKIPKIEYIMYVVLGITASIFCMWSILGSDPLYTSVAFIIVLSSAFFYTQVEKVNK